MKDGLDFFSLDPYYKEHVPGKMHRLEGENVRLDGRLQHQGEADLDLCIMKGSTRR